MARLNEHEQLSVCQKTYHSVMKYREQKKSRWRFAVAFVLIALFFSCGVLIALDVRKLAEEKKVEAKYAPPKTQMSTAPTLPQLPQTEN